MLLLPILAITLTIIVPIFWFFIVPKVARMLTWCRFKNVSIHAIADDSGFVEFVPTNVELAEGVVRTKRGWRFLPRPIWKPLNPTEKRDEKLEEAEKVVLRKYVLKGLGKPFWFGYAGMVAATNPAALASIQQEQPNPIKRKIIFKNLETYISSLPKQFLWNNQTIHIQKELGKIVKQLHDYIKARPLTLIDPRAVKEILPETTPPSLMEAIETYSEMVGMEQKGKEYGKLILGGTLIIGLVVFGIVALAMLT